MEETLKTVRFLHRAVVALSAVLFVSALSPRLFERYEDALQEVKELQKIHAEGAFEQCEKYMRDNLSRQPLLNLLSGNYLKNQLYSAVGFSGMLLFEGKKDCTITDTFKAPSAKSTIEEQWTFLVTRPEVWANVPDMNEIVSILTPVVKSQPPDGNLWFAIDEDEQGLIACWRIARKGVVIKDRSPDDDVQFFQKWQAQKAAWGDLIVGKHRLTSGRKRLVQKEMPPSLLLHRGYGPFRAKKLDMQTLDRQKWRRQVLESFSPFLEPKPKLSSFPPLPSLRRIWPSVHDKTLLEASSYLQERVIESQNKVSVLGMSFNESFLGWLGPILMFLLLLYLYKHLVHVHSIKNGHDEFLKTYPWMPLYHDKISRLLTFLSLVVAPFMATACLTSSTWDSLSAASYIALTLTVGSLACGWYSYKICVVLYKGLWDEGASPGTGQSPGVPAQPKQSSLCPAKKPRSSKRPPAKKPQ